jgi:hypothetical protein
MTATTSTMTVTSPRTSLTLIALMALSLFRQAAVRERMLLAARGGRVAEDAVAVAAGRVVRAPVHLRVAAAIDRFYLIHYQRDRALARPFCLGREWRS